MLSKETKDRLPIKTFTLDMFVTNPAIIMIAKRGSGMSFTSKDLEKYSKLNNA